MTVLRSGSATDPGLVRHNNQDQLLVTETLVSVADGMGGHAGGEIASQLAITALREAFIARPEPRTSEDLVAAVARANEAVFEGAQVDPSLRGMGTTLTAAALVVTNGEERIAIANVGDSRTYVFSQGELTQLTEDHSVAEELVRQGQIAPEEADTHPQRHILTRAIGIYPTVDTDLWEVLPHTGNRLVLCSDGLVREVTDDQIAAVLRRLADPTEAAADLVARARAAGGSDNITVVVVNVADDAPAPSGAGRAKGARRGWRSRGAAGSSASTGAAGAAAAGSAAAPEGTAPTGSANAAGAPPASGPAVAAPGAEAGVKGTAGPAGATAATTTTTRSPIGDAGATASGSPAARRPDDGPAPRPGGAGDGRANAPAVFSPYVPPPLESIVPLPPRPRRITVRLVAFVLVIGLVFAGGAVAVVTYARDSYFVTLGPPSPAPPSQVAAASARPLLIYKGRPGGLLWFKPTLAQHTQVLSTQVLPARLPDLQKGRQEPSLAAARTYVANLVAEAASAASANPVSPTGAESTTTSP